MPYQAGRRLTRGEAASKLGHLDIVQNTAVAALIDSFEYPPEVDGIASTLPWGTWIDDGSGAQPDELPLVMAVDGSLQTINSDGNPRRSLSFVKTALIRLDSRRIAKISHDRPHPLEMRDLMSDSALHTATALPLRNVRVKGMSNYDLVRQIIRTSLLEDPNHGDMTHKTLKWLAYRKWRNDQTVRSPKFMCPHCSAETEGLPYDADVGKCEFCDELIYIADMIGFHLEMGEEQAPESLAIAYMNMSETLLLFSVVRHYWEAGDFNTLTKVLLLKDGPLTLRSQYSKLVENLRELFTVAAEQGHPIHLVGQEKTGRFVEHLADYGSPQIELGEKPQYAVLSHRYVRAEVDHAPDRANPYGSRTNYGEKVFVKLDSHTAIVLSVPTGAYNPSLDFPASADDLIDFGPILATLPSLISVQHEGALVPISLANGVASLSNYPSATVLKLFAGI